MSNRRRLWAMGGLVGTRIANAAMQFATLILLARAVSIEAYGGYAAAVGFGSVLGGLIGLGLVARALLVGAASETDLPGPMVAYTTILAGLAGVGVYVFAALHGGGADGLALAGAAFVATEMVNGVVANLLLGARRQRAASGVMVLQRGIPLLLVGIAAVMGGSLTFYAASVGFFLSAISSVIVLGRQEWSGWKFRELILGARHYWFASAWSMLQQLDVTIVSSINGLSAAGGYGAAFRLASPIHIVTSSIASIMVPHVRSHSTRDERSAAARPYLLLGGGYALLIVFLSPLAGVVGPWAFGSEYAPYSALFTIFFVSSAFSVVNQLQIGRLYAEDRPRSVARSNAVGAIVGLSLLAVGALLGGVFWAAVGYASSRVVLTVVLFISNRRNG